MAWSTYQEAIFSALPALPRGHAIAINAGPGAGKTTTAVEAAKTVKRGTALFVAFNRHIAQALNDKLSGTRFEAATLHATGRRAVANSLGGRVDVKPGKYDDLVKEWLDSPEGRVQWQRHNFTNQWEAKRTLSDLIEFARLALPDLKDLTAFARQADAAGLECPDGFAEATVKLLKKGSKLADNDGVIDFADMIYLPHRWDLPVPQPDWVFVDECQDLSPALLDLVGRLRGPNSRVLAIGDPMQSIFGFAHADTRAFSRLSETLDAKQMILPVCYRCPTSHVAQEIRPLNPLIEAAPGAKDGWIYPAAPHQIPKLVQEEADPSNILILCRFTAPLINQAAKLLRAGIPAKVRGRDFGETIARTIEQIARNFDCESAKEIEDCARQWADEQRRKLEARGCGPGAIANKTNLAHCVIAVAQSWPTLTVSGLVAQVRRLFSDEAGFAGPTLSTIHRAKGLEAEHVILLGARKLGQPVSRRSSPEQDEQERNLRYVAVSRSKNGLTMVDEVDGDEGMDESEKAEVSNVPQA